MSKTKIEELRKKAARLKEEAKKAELAIKQLKEEVNVKLGAEAVKFLNGSMSLDEFKLVAMDLGIEIGGAE